MTAVVRRMIVVTIAVVAGLFIGLPWNPRAATRPLGGTSSSYANESQKEARDAAFFAVEGQQFVAELKNGILHVSELTRDGADRWRASSERWSIPVGRERERLEVVSAQGADWMVNDYVIAFTLRDPETKKCSYQFATILSSATPKDDVIQLYNMKLDAVESADPYEIRCVLNPYGDTVQIFLSLTTKTAGGRRIARDTLLYINDCPMPNADLGKLYRLTRLKEIPYEEFGR